MADDFLTGADSFRFKGMALMGNLVEWSDTRKPRLAVQEFLKVDGARVEYMGRAPHRFKGLLIFMGPTWRDQVKNFISSTDSSPHGLLVHPLFGQMQATYEGVEGARVAPGQERDVVTFPVSFVENNLNAKIDPSQAQGVAAKQQLVTSRVAALVTALAVYGPSTVAAGASLAASATAYATAAATAGLASIPDPSLGPRLDSVASSAQSTIATLRADPTQPIECLKFDGIMAAELVYAACRELADSVNAQRPTIVAFTVPAAMSIAVIAAMLYGVDGRGRIDEILTLNPTVGNPANIAAGTVLRVGQPTASPTG